MYQLRIRHRSGIACFDVESVEAGWKMWAGFIHNDNYYRLNTTTVQVLLASAPL
jgi:hypothetical protein